MTISYYQHGCYLNYKLNKAIYNTLKKKKAKFCIWKGVGLSKQVVFFF